MVPLSGKRNSYEDSQTQDSSLSAPLSRRAYEAVTVLGSGHCPLGLLWDVEEGVLLLGA